MKKAMLSAARISLSQASRSRDRFAATTTALFVDAGNAFNGEEFDPAVGTGFGIKWRSPVGPVRLYIGFPIDEPDRSPRVHLRLGAEL